MRWPASPGAGRSGLALARELVRPPTSPPRRADEPPRRGAILWLEGLLGRAPFATITVTHDRLFLQRVANRILELDPGTRGLLDVRGNYETYLT